MSGTYNRQDHFYELAKQEGYRSRAAYKLKELNQRFKFLRSGNRVLDLGAWPGGWLQVVLETLGTHGRAVGIDLQQIEELQDDRILFIQGDVRDEEPMERALEFAGELFDVVISDMSPKLSGVREVDGPACVGCAELTLWRASQFLKPGGFVVLKLFKGLGTDEFVKQARPQFGKLHRVELESTRKTSNEFYLVGVDFRKPGV